MKDLVQQRQEAAFGGACVMGVMAALIVLVGITEPALTAAAPAEVENVDITVRLTR